MRFAQIKEKKIVSINSKDFPNAILIPDSLKDVSDKELIINYTYSDKDFQSSLATKPIKELKIAFISNYKQRCGISTYAEALLEHLAPQCKDFKFFIESSDLVTSDVTKLNDVTIPDDKIVPCWKRGAPLDDLCARVKEFNPDIVWINHEWGLFDNARYFLSLLTQLSNFRVVCTMHSTYYHKDKSIIEAAIPEIIVHLEGAKEVLKEIKQVPGQVYVIPHGFYSLKNEAKLWNFYKSNQTIIQLGFGFRYKRFEWGLKAVQILKSKYPDIFLTCLFSQSGFNILEHQTYFNELVDLTQELKIENNVALIKGFQSDISIDSYLRTNQVALFPYGVNDPNHEVFGASGAARLALSKNLPTVTSSIHHFSDLPTIKGDSPEEIAKQLDMLFSNKENIKKQVIKQNVYAESLTWDKIAQKYVSVFERNF
jgi:glycosyltransferase involved in cell wall biosynthesis